MIKDKLCEADWYKPLSAGIKEGLEWLQKTDLKNLNDGRYKLSGENYVNVQSYDTKEDALYEAHRNYIDIQYMITGAEKCGICSYKLTKTETEYNKEKDIEFLTCDKGEFITLSEGEFLILFPQDAHKPSINLNNKSHVKKAVAKIHI